VHSVGRTVAQSVIGWRRVVAPICTWCVHWATY